MGNLICNVSLFHYLIISLVLFVIGFVGVIISKNIFKVLISMEFMLTSVNINFIAFSSFVDNVNMTGYVFSIFYIGIGAIELAIAVAIFYLMYKSKHSVDINDYKELKG